MATDLIEELHDEYEDKLMKDISEQMQRYRTWMTDVFFRQNLLPAMMRFTEQMSAVAMHQVFIIGTFLDAKHQLETQQLFQELQTQAHKDYHPSDDFCWFGTGVRSMAHTEQRGRFNAVALAQMQQSRHLGNVNVAGSESQDWDKTNRWNQFVAKYCDQQDNNWRATVANTGLVLACPSDATTKRANIDIEYTRAIDEPRTLEVDFSNAGAPTNDEEDILALSKNLYGHNVLTRQASPAYLKSERYQHLYMALRSVAAKRSVAENSFDAIIGLKSFGTDTGGPGTNRFLGAILTELGVPPADVYKIIGNQPSYYAQLELLAKKIYQNPDFYSNLYDKPANIKRKSIALKAIDLMLDRAIYESQLRQEMAMSVLLSARLRPLEREVNKNLPTAGSE